MLVAAHALTVALLLAWAIWQGSFPQFSDVGYL